MAADAAETRRRAIAANSAAWRLIDQPTRTPAEDTAMIEAAHESDRLWKLVGTGVNRQRGAWLIARAYVAAGVPEAAQWFAGETLALTEAHRAELADFDFAFAEMIAGMAAALAGDRTGAASRKARAKALGEAIAGPGDRAEFFRQFAEGPWFGA